MYGRPLYCKVKKKYNIRTRVYKKVLKHLNLFKLSKLLAWVYLKKSKNSNLNMVSFNQLQNLLNLSQFEL